MGYTLTQINTILSKADRAIHILGSVAYNKKFAELDETYWYDRDIIFLYKYAVEWGKVNDRVGTARMDSIVERLEAMMEIYDYGSLAPIYSQVAQVTGISTINFLTEETDPTVPAWVKLITQSNIANWDDSYGNKVTSAAVTGTNTKTLTLNQQDGGTVTASWTDINTDAVSSVFGRTGAIVAQSGDYTTTQVTEGLNLYYTDGRVRNAISESIVGIDYNSTTGVFSTTAGYSIPTSSSQANWDTAYANRITSLTTTGTSGAATLISNILNIPAYTLAGLGGISLTSLSASSPLLYNNTTGVFSIQVANGSQNGYLSSTDWTTFNSKQSALTFSSPLVNISGTVSIPAATSSVNGYLTSTDWITFNNKQSAGNYITSLTGEATASGPGNASVTLSTSAVTGKILSGLNLTAGGTIIDTDSILQAFGKVQNQISGLFGGVTYQGIWNASINSPSLNSFIGTKGYYYIVSVDGSTNLNGITDWKVGDWVVFNGSSWDKVDNTDAVSSVNGFTGAVSLTTSSISEGTNLYYSDSRSRLALSFMAGSGNYNSISGVITIPTNTSQLTNGASFITLSSINSTAPIQYNNTTGNISITQAGVSSNGYLSSTDWNTFNNKQSAIINGVTGTGTNNFISKFTGSTTISSSQIYDDGTSVLIGATGYLPNVKVGIYSTSQRALEIVSTNSNALFVQSPAAYILTITNGIWYSQFTNTGRLDLAGDLLLNTITKATIDTDRFLVSDGGVIKYRTGAELLSDIGGQPSGTYVTSVGVTRSGDALSITGSPITSSGTINIGFSGSTTQYVRGDGTLATFPSVITNASTLVTEVYNETGATLTKGTIVYINGTHGNLPTVTKALATGDATSAQTFGFIQDDIGNMSNGYVVQVGKLTNLNTNGYVDGTQLYLSGTTAGTYTSTKSYAPTHLVYVGVVVRAHPTQGVIEVKIQNGYEMDELHNVSAQSPNNGDILQYVTSTSLWTKVAGTTSNISEGTNLYYTEARVNANANVAANTAARHNAVTIGTANGLSLSTQVLSLALSSSSTTGALSSTDWTTFNNKQNALTNPVTGTGTTNYLPKFTGTSTIGNSLVYDNGTNIGIGTTSPESVLSVQKNVAGGRGGEISIVNYAAPTVGNEAALNFGIEASTYGSDNGNFQIKAYLNNTNGATDAIFSNWSGSAFLERMRISSAGNVGIGTTSPSTLLHVKGTTNGPIRAENTSSTGYATHTSFNDTGANMSIGMGGSAASLFAGVGFIDTGGAIPLIFATNDVERARVTAAGNFGIGTTSPSEKLSVIGNIYANGGLSSYRTDGGIGLDVNGGDLGQGSYIARFKDFSNNPQVVILGNGRLGIGTTSPAQALDVNSASSTDTDLKYNLVVRSSDAFSTTPQAGIAFATYFNGSSNLPLVGIYGGKENATSGDFAGKLSFATRPNGGNITERLRITSGGAINIKDGTLTGGGGFEFTSEAFFGARFQSNAYKFMAGDNSTEYMRLTSTGLGIGTTNPQVKLVVSNSGNLGLEIDPTNTSGTVVNMFAYDRVASVYRTIALNSGGGNVGIGTTSPATLLQVKGNGVNMISVQYTADAGSAGYGFYNSAGTELWSIGGGRFVSQDAFEISRQGSLKFLINSSGNVGIGTTSPAYLLDVRGSGMFNGDLRLDNNELNTPKTLFFSANSTTGGSYGNIKWYNVQWDGYTRGEIVVEGDGALSNGRMIFKVGPTNSNATEAMRITSNGYVGIGTTNVASKFNIRGASSNAQLEFNNFSSGVNYLLSYDRVASAYREILLITNASNNSLYVATSGNIGIGTTSPNVSGQGANQRVLTVQGSSDYGVIEVATSSTAAGNLLGAYGFASSGLSATYKLPAYIGSWLDGGGVTSGANMRFHTQANGTAGASERVRITSAGNVGIGTTSPTSTLSVIGSSDIRSATGASGTGYALEMNTNSSTPRIDLVDNGTYTGAFKSNANIVTVGNNSANPLVFTTGGTERARITSVGNIGVGTTAPTDYTIYGYGPVIETRGGVGGVFITKNSTGTLLGSFSADSGSSLIKLKAETNHALAFFTNDLEKARITTSGNFNIKNGTITTGASFSITALNTNTVINSTPYSGLIVIRDNTNGGSAVWLADPNMGYIQISNNMPGTFSMSYGSGVTNIQKNSGSVPVNYSVGFYSNVLA
jgi:hypothetical protein